jgi:leukotriene-A4 hydrolase
MKTLSVALCALLMLASCVSADMKPKERSEKTKMKIAQMKLARDPHTWSKPNEARVKHLNWSARVDFNTHRISANAQYDIENITGTDTIHFDTKGLQIKSVQVDGKAVSFTLGAEKPIIGAPLAVPIQAESHQVNIEYTTSPNAEALLWVDGDKPFLFSQSQAILARTWIPCQDSPGVRLTYHAHVEVPAGLMALMSAENPQSVNANGEYDFVMDQPIPSYLMALAVGDIAFKPIGDRTGVYATPDMLDKAAWEFADMQRMVEAAEALYGPYVWGRYDLLILPSAFPFGGMENPKLTFATPTIIAGDRSLVSLVAHELAHSWSGNLVTNSTWDDFWLNEGFTVYFEQRIMEAVYGRDLSEMLAQLNRQDLDATIQELQTSEHPEDTRLKLALEGRSPDDGMTDIAYNKGYFFLRLIEEHVGREKFDPFIKRYFDTYQFQVMDTENFLEFLKSNLLTAEDYQSLQVEQWVYGNGLPQNIPSVQSKQLVVVDSWREKFESNEVRASDIPWMNWSYQERYRFISNWSAKVTIAKMDELDAAFHINETGNNEVLFAWLKQSILKQRASSYEALKAFLVHVGRRKFVSPLYQALMSTGQEALAREIYTQARSGYHAVTVETIDGILSETKEP